MLKRALITDVALVLFVTTAFAADIVGPKIQPLMDKPLIGDETRHIVTALIDWPAGSKTGWHSHPGEEFATVVKGAVEVETKGSGATIYETGDAYYNARGIVHQASAVGNQPAQTVATLIVDKGQALSIPAK